MMNLSNDTLALLKNFANINQNILIKPGKKLNTISTMKNILATADIFPKIPYIHPIYQIEYCTLQFQMANQIPSGITEMGNKYLDSQIEELIMLKKLLFLVEMNINN